MSESTGISHDGTVIEIDQPGRRPQPMNVGETISSREKIFAKKQDFSPSPAQGKYLIEISAQPACASCGAKSLCSSAGTTAKHIRAVSSEALQLGDRVQVIMEERLGWKAIFYSFVLPFLVMMLALCGAYAAGAGDTHAALSAVGSLVPYYFLLYLFKKKIEKDFIFKAFKNQNERGES